MQKLCGDSISVIVAMFAYLILNLLMHAHNNKIISHAGRNHFSIITKVYLRDFELCFTPCLWGNVLKVVLTGDVGHPAFSHL